MFLRREIPILHWFFLMKSLFFHKYQKVINSYKKNEDVMKTNAIFETLVPENFKVNFCQTFCLKILGGQNFHFQRNS